MSSHRGDYREQQYVWSAPGAGVKTRKHFALYGEKNSSTSLGFAVAGGGVVFSLYQHMAARILFIWRVFAAASSAARVPHLPHGWACLPRTSAAVYLFSLSRLCTHRYTVTLRPFIAAPLAAKTTARTLLQRHQGW